MKHSVNILTLGVLAAFQVGYLLTPVGTVGLYNRLLPVFYAAILTVYIILTGREYFPAPIGGNSASAKSSAIYAAMFILLLYVAAVFVTSVLLGVARNRDAASLSRILNNLWIFAAPALIAEVLRAGIIRSTRGGSHNNRVFITVALVLVYTFTQLNALRGELFEARVIQTFFIGFIPALTMNGVLTYMAFTAPLRALLLVRTLFLFPHLSPAIPNTSGVVWASVTCGILFLAVIIYHLNMRTPEGGFQKAAKKRLLKPSIASHALLSGILAVFAAFFLRAFPYFPSIVLTGSMRGEIDRGSVAIVRKVAQKDVVDKLKVGDVVLISGEKVEIMHRVVEIKQDNEDGTLYITKGDANLRPDSEPVAPEQIVGVIESYIPYAGWPVVVLRSIFVR